MRKEVGSKLTAKQFKRLIKLIDNPLERSTLLIEVSDKENSYKCACDGEPEIALMNWFARSAMDGGKEAGATKQETEEILMAVFKSMQNTTMELMKKLMEMEGGWE